MNQEPREEPCGTISETVASSESSAAGREGVLFDGGSRIVETSNQGQSSEVRANSSCGETYRNSNSCASACSLSREQQCSNPVSLNVSANQGAVDYVDNSAENGGLHIGSDPRDSNLDALLLENNTREETTIDDSGSASVPPVSDLLVTYLTRGEESVREALPSGLGLIMSNREHTGGEGSSLHIDIVSISSNILPAENVNTRSQETRGNDRRMFWDALSRRSSSRLSDSPGIFFSSDDNDDLGSHDRWLLDFNSEFYDWAGGDSNSFGSRIHSLNEQRRNSRSEIWQRLHRRRDENGRRTTFCSSGLHPDGTCSCDLFSTTDERSTRANLSRIVMLAEALFEVLDEIHRHPLSLALSMVSPPAPESVVDSFPLRSHKKADTAVTGDAIEQCHICLAEYEEDDKIRILPCHHEYHMSCVDKWLKEIHGVCPLCRGDVRQGRDDSSVSDLGIPSL